MSTSSTTPPTAITSDLVLACLLPLFVLFVSMKVIGPLSWSELRDLLSLKTSHNVHNDGLFSLRRAYLSYNQYPRLAFDELTRMRASYSTLGRKSKRLGYTLGYVQKLDRLQLSIEVNSIITERIADLAMEDLGANILPTVGMARNAIGPMGELGRVREALKHYIRDWSEVGKVERDRIFQPILDVLRQVDETERGTKRVLVPGSGLGRLAWDISKLGFDTTANELSYFMNLAFRFLLSEKATSRINEHTIRPYAHWFSHQRSNDTLFRAVSFPDDLPRLGPKFHLVEKDFLTLPTGPTKPAFWLGSSPGSSDSVGNDGNPQSEEQYDFVVTLFFIDTSLDLFATLDHIYALLKPGGTWINLGPLLWTSGGQAKVELSLDEVLRAAEEIGFILDGEGDRITRRRSVECEYTADLEAMMRWIYKAEFWVARKSKA